MDEDETESNLLNAPSQGWKPRKNVYAKGGNIDINSHRVDFLMSLSSFMLPPISLTKKGQQNDR